MKKYMLKWEIDKFWFETFEITFEINQLFQAEFKYTYMYFWWNKDRHKKTLS